MKRFLHGAAAIIAVFGILTGLLCGCIRTESAPQTEPPAETAAPESASETPQATAAPVETEPETEPVSEPETAVSTEATPETEPEPVPETAPERPESVYSYWTEPAEIVMTDELEALLDGYFRDTAERGTVINGAVPAEGVRFTADSTVAHQTVEGFGCSGCWWACFSGDWDDTALDEVLLLLYSDTYGIGLTSYRHNVGGGTPETFYGKGATKCVEVFPGFYDIGYDAAGIRVMNKLKSIGVDYFTLFMNSPPARMTDSGSSLGAIDGGSNLREECFAEYAAFCADIAELYTLAGIPVKYLSPINEPQWNWKASSYQEGCHYSTQEVAKLDELLVLELEQRGLDTMASIPETAAWYDDAYSRYLVSTLNYNKKLTGKIDHIAGHSYGSNRWHKEALAAYYQIMGITLPVHQTEWCITDGDRMAISRVVHEDMTILDTTLWEYWVGVEPDNGLGGGGALTYVDTGNNIAGANLQYYFLGQYSRFIAGATRIDLSPDTEIEGLYGSAYVKDGQTILVLTNETEQEQPVCFGGTGSENAGVWQTTEDGALLLQYIGDVQPDCGYVLPARSVTTFVFAP